MTFDISEQQIVVIPFEHLNPNLKLIITNLSDQRNLRINQDVITQVSGLAISSIAGRDDNLHELIARVALQAAITGAVTPLMPYRNKRVKQIQDMHEIIKERMNRYGIIHTKYESEYPKGWNHTEVVARTHPIFSIAMNGDVIFRQVNRKEYLKWMLQKGVIGRYGINPWFWRGYLEPPKAPESIKEWAKKRYKEIIEKIKEKMPSPEPLPEPALGRKIDEIRRLRARHE